MIRFPVVLALALAPLLLAGCGKSDAPQTGSKASGEILPGTVTDAMLDTDRSQAEAPLAPAARSPSDKTDAAAGAMASGSAIESDGTAQPAPAEGSQPSPKPGASAKPAAR
jgi:hypothetical protein